MAAAAAGLLLAVLVPAVATELRRPANSPAPPAPTPPAITAEELVAYEDALAPVVKDWGSIEILGMRPAIADLRAGTELGSPELVAVQARAWQAALETDRAKLADLQPPAAVQDARRLFLESMDLYLDATATFLAATATEGSERQQTIQVGIGQAAQGAHVYNRASALLQGARRTLGLGPSPTFPDAAA